MNAKTMLTGCLICLMGATGAFGASRELTPQKHYPDVAKRVANMLPSYHLSQKKLDDSISVKAWTNLITGCDYAHMVFRQEDLDRFAPMKTRIDDALRNGDVSFGFEVWKTFIVRLEERINFVTNLLVSVSNQYDGAGFDFSVKEDYPFQRKDAPWPQTREEQDNLWRCRIKNEILSAILGKELDDEKALAESNRVAQAKAAGKPIDKKDEAKKDEDEKDDPEPIRTPIENAIRRYHRYWAFVTEQTDEENVLQRYLSSVTQAYDPHTDYISPMSKEDFDMSMNLSLCGVGATLSYDEDDGSLKIVDISKGGPVDRDKRIRKGDKIFGVGQGDGPIEDILFKPMKKTIRKIRGKKGTKVVLKIKPKRGGGMKKIALIRDEIKLEDQAATGRVENVVAGGVTNRIGYVKLPSFYGSMGKKPGDIGYSSCSYDVAKHIARFNAENVPGMVLDLRGNGGGSLPESVLLSALFEWHAVPVVLIRDTQQMFALPTFPDKPAFAWRKPLVVMIDRASASASEIVAGALRDTGRAIVVGDHQTHGKGTVQTVMPVGPEQFGAMKITTARFYRINGSSTQVRGVPADILLPSTLDGLDIGEDKLPNALAWTRIEPAAYQPIWNMGAYIDQLTAFSKKRLAGNADWARHLKAVKLFKESAERKTVPLERVARKQLMREEREMRTIEDDADAPDDEDPEETAYYQSERLDRRDDMVLNETFRIVIDLIALTRGGEAYAEPVDDTPAWQRLFK